MTRIKEHEKNEEELVKFLKLSPPEQQKFISQVEKFSNQEIIQVCQKWSFIYNQFEKEKLEEKFLNHPKLSEQEAKKIIDGHIVAFDEGSKDMRGVFKKGVIVDLKNEKKDELKDKLDEFEDKFDKLEDKLDELEEKLDEKKTEKKKGIIILKKCPKVKKMNLFKSNGMIF